MFDWLFERNEYCQVLSYNDVWICKRNLKVKGSSIHDFYTKGWLDGSVMNGVGLLGSGSPKRTVSTIKKRVKDISATAWECSLNINGVRQLYYEVDDSREIQSIRNALNT